MSTNTEPSNWLDEGLLQQLANQYFKAVPGTELAPEGAGVTPGSGFPAPGGFSATDRASATPVGGFSSTDAVFAAPGSSFPATDGFVSPGGGFASPDRASATPQGAFAGGDIVRPSSPAANPAIAQAPSVPVAGPTGNTSLGKIGHQESFDIKDPQSSLPDPHFTDGRVPASVAGSGRSPAMNKAGAGNESRQGGTSASSFGPGSSSPSYAQGRYPFESDLSPIFQEIAAFVKGPQLPDVNFREPDYYFLPGADHPLRGSAGGEGAKHPLGEAHRELSNGGNAGAKSRFGNGRNPIDVAGGYSPIGAGSGLTSGINGLTGLSAQPFDVNAVRNDFPILRQLVNGRPLIWLDNAATTQKPKQVIDRISYFYQNENSNIHRAAHELAARATDAYEGARKKVQEFLNAASPNEIVFVRGATEAINLVAKSWGEQHLGAGDEVIVSHLEHHANIVPWQQLAEKKGIKLRVIPVDDRGQLLLNEYASLLNSKTKLVSVTQVSNALGTITPVQQIAAMAHAVGAKVLVDGAQSVSHMRVDVQAIDADWFVLSGHKLYAPTGIGVLYGKEGLLNATQPWQGGGNMIKDVTFEHTQYQSAPGRFEAGTGNIADAVGLGAAIDYISRLGMERIAAYEHYLLEYGTRLLQQVPGLHLIGTAEHKASVLSFILDGFTNDEVGQALNKEGIAVRTGHHCAQPILRRFGVESTVRPSLAFYNTCGEIDVLVNVLHRLRRGR